MKANIITLRIYRPAGVSRIALNLDILAEQACNPKYKYTPFQQYKELRETCYPVKDFKRICELILRHAEDAEVDLADEVFLNSQNDKCRKVWSDVKAKFNRA